MQRRVDMDRLQELVRLHRMGTGVREIASLPVDADVLAEAQHRPQWGVSINRGARDREPVRSSGARASTSQGSAALPVVLDPPQPVGGGGSGGLATVTVAWAELPSESMTPTTSVVPPAVPAVYTPVAGLTAPPEPLLRKAHV